MSVIWDETGARFSFYYRTFVSGGKRYYTTPYTTNVTITMEVPLYVDRDNNENKLYLLNLPYDTKYEVSGNLDLDSLLKKDEYEQIPVALQKMVIHEYLAVAAGKKKAPAMVK